MPYIMYFHFLIYRIRIAYRRRKFKVFVYTTLYKMSSFIKEFVSRNLRNPQKGLGAFWAERFFIKRNTSLMINTVSLADIHPDHVVLELGYGPGVGLEEAWKHIKDGNGKLYGIDISKPMFNAATKRLSKQIATGRVNIAIGDVHLGSPRV